jgi:glycosyltransferase involved in cell wall biosynthesis
VISHPKNHAEDSAATTESAQTGVSIVICCHNSAKRIPETLRHLAAQTSSTEIAWEVLVIDNGSTDTTADAATSSWPEDADAPLRIVSEPKLGLAFARQRGLAEAAYDFVSFIDDDNWVCVHWVNLVHDLMLSKPKVGICGGSSEAVCEIPPPTWWSRCNMLLAISPPDWQGGDVTDTGRTIWGAGMTLRKSAIRDLERQGFQPLLSDRRGSSLVSCGDTELCLAFRVAGWRLWYEPTLSLKHYMPAARLNWQYLRRLYRASGESSTGCDPYYFLLNQASGTSGRNLGLIWFRQLLASALGLLRQPGEVIRAIFSQAEGRTEILQTEIALGRFLSLIKSRKAYVGGIQQVGLGRWHQTGSSAVVGGAPMEE